MKAFTLFRWLAALMVPVLAAAGADERYGILPAGMSSVSEISDVSAEICRDHLFDPAKFTGRLPPGYRLVTAAEYAADDPAVAAFLQANPGCARYAVGSLCFMSVGKFEVDGTNLLPSGRTPMAFWWARAEGPRDETMRGKVEWLQLASWYSRDLTDRAKVLATDPTAEFTELRVEEIETGVWHLRLVLPGEVIEARVRGSGELAKRPASADNFMSVPMAGKGAGHFWVITYFGHQHQPVRGEWQSRGHGVFSSAWQIPGEAEVFGTIFQSSWSALSGLYPGPDPAR